MKQKQIFENAINIQRLEHRFEMTDMDPYGSCQSCKDSIPGMPGPTHPDAIV